MDRPISKQKRAGRRFRLLILPLCAALAVWLGGHLLFAYLSPAVDRNMIRTAIVDRGNIVAGVQASGSLAPQTETVITSPIDSRILRILKAPGARVNVGEPILELDTAAHQLELEKLDEQLALKENAKHQLDLETNQNMSANQTQSKLNLLDLRHAESRLAQKQKLAAQGLVSEEELQQIRLEVDKMRLQHQQLEEERLNQQAVAQTRRQGLELECRILQKTRDESRQRLARAAAGSPLAGVVTQVPDDVGGTVRQGQTLARIADLQTLKLSAGISDYHAARIQTGMPAVIRVNQRDIDGVVARLLPAVEDGVFKFEVTFENKAEYSLRRNMRAEVFVLTGRRDNVPRMRKGPAVPGPGRQTLFVVRGDKAYQRELEIGLAGMDYFEVINGLELGEEVVISDMRRFRDLPSVKLK